MKYLIHVEMLLLKFLRPLRNKQLNRKAKLRDDPQVDTYWDAFRWQSDHAEQGRPLDQPPRDPLTIITPERILYTEHWLRRSGHSARQTWRPN